MKRKINKWNKLYLEDKLDLEHVTFSYNSWLGYIIHSNGYNLKNKITERMMFSLEVKNEK